MGGCSGRYPFRRAAPCRSGGRNPEHGRGPTEACHPGEHARKRYCETLRTNLAQLENNPRVRVEENGEVRRITEEERQSRIAEAKQKIGENCQ